MKTSLTLFVSILAVTVFNPGLVLAEQSQNDHEDRIEHYAGESISSKEQAWTVMKNKKAEIAKILEAEALAGADLEKIHEVSYSLEAAIDRLIEEKAAEQSQLDNMNEAIQALHFASENHEEEKTRTWFAKLQDASGSDASMQMEAAAPADQMAAEKPEYVIVIKDHTFSPETITVPAGKKIKLIVDNQDMTPEEFESHDMNREKIISGNSKATIFVGPLQPGKYHYFGEFNMDSANGYIIAE